MCTSFGLPTISVYGGVDAVLPIQISNPNAANAFRQATSIDSTIYCSIRQKLIQGAGQWRPVPRPIPTISADYDGLLELELPVFPCLSYPLYANYPSLAAPST